MNTLEENISSISSVLENYKNRFGQIELFIGFAEGQKDYSEEAIVKDPDSFFVKTLRQLNNSTVIYNAVIISIYGSFELFIDEVLLAYIEYLKGKRNSFDAFPDKLKNKHVTKGADFIMNSQRYVGLGLNTEQVIKSLESFLVRKQPSGLINDLLLSHSGNLNSKQLNNLLGEFGFDNAIIRLTKHTGFSRFCEELQTGHENQNGETSLCVLDAIVEERNKVAHGWRVDDRYSFSLIRERFCCYIKSLCEAVSDLIKSKMIQDAIDEKALSSFGPIIHTWKSGHIIGLNCSDLKLSVGSYIYSSNGEKWNYCLEIKNLRVNNMDRKRILVRNQEVAIEVDRQVSDRNTIWGYKRFPFR